MLSSHISARLLKLFLFATKSLTVQHEVNFHRAEYRGTSVKLLPKAPDPNCDQFHSKTLFEEDYRMHFTFQHEYPKTGIYDKKLAKHPGTNLKTYFSDMNNQLILWS